MERCLGQRCPGLFQHLRGTVHPDHLVIKFCQPASVSARTEAASKAAPGSSVSKMDHTTGCSTSIRGFPRCCRSVTIVRSRYGSRRLVRRHPTVYPVAAQNDMADLLDPLGRQLVVLEDMAHKGNALDTDEVLAETDVSGHLVRMPQMAVECCR